jgi:AraC-like DNA-binding protein
VRADLALKYLRQSALRFAEISEILGFAEPSVFSRSFRRWHGCTPREARRRIVRGRNRRAARMDADAHRRR